MQHRQGRNTRRAELRQAVEHASAMGPQLHGVLQEVGAGTLHEVHERQLVPQRKLQHTE